MTGRLNRILGTIPQTHTHTHTYIHAPFFLKRVASIPIQFK
jgi:hypothetical protein